jgi:hypothetical protein
MSCNKAAFYREKKPLQLISYVYNLSIRRKALPRKENITRKAPFEGKHLEGSNRFICLKAFNFFLIGWDAVSEFSNRNNKGAVKPRLMKFS